MELATLVFMQYMREGDAIKPLPLRVVDTGYGLERFAWMSQGTKTIYETVFPKMLPEIPSEISPPEAALLLDHARVFALILADGVVPSNVKEGYLARLLLRRIMRTLEKHPGTLTLHDLFSLIIRHGAWNLKEIGANPKGLLDLVDVEEKRFHETLERGRSHVRRLEERLRGEGKKIGATELLELYDSMGLTPDVVVEELKEPVKVPDDFFALVAKMHEKADEATPEGERSAGPSEVVPSPPHTLPATEVLYQMDPYTSKFTSNLIWTEGPWVLLDRTYFYPTGGGQITDTGKIGDNDVTEVVRKGPFVLHHLGQHSAHGLAVGQKVECSIDVPRRRQLMQHHTATHVLNGALREVFGPHIWQAGAYKGVEGARLDVTHYKQITEEELRKVERIANRIVSEDRPVKSYYSQRSEAEARFGFTLYQGGAVPGKEIRIIEIEKFDVEACGGTHCTHTSEIGLIKALSTERIQDGMVRVNFVAGDRALEVVQEQGWALRTLSQKLAVPPEQLPQALDALLLKLREKDKATRTQTVTDVRELARKLLGSNESAIPIGGERYIAVKAVIGQGAASLKDLARELTKDPKVIAILASEEGDKGSLFIASGSPKVISAAAILDESKKVWPGRGGGNPSAAMAFGTAGESLLRAMDSALSQAKKTAESSGHP
jgi:alanyl-tRNA synthetase